MHTALVLATLLSQTPSQPAVDSGLDPWAPAPSLPSPGAAVPPSALPASSAGTASLLATPEEPLPSWVRIPTMALSGLALGAAATAGGVLGPELLHLPRTGDLGPSTAQLVGGGAGALFGTSVGVWGVSRLMGGQGSYAGSLLGTAAGMGVGVGLVAAAVHVNSDPLSNATLLVAPTLPVLGAVLGHEWSVPSTPQGLQVTPSLAVDASGAQAGLSGRF